MSERPHDSNRAEEPAEALLVEDATVPASDATTQVRRRVYLCLKVEVGAGLEEAPLSRLPLR